MNLDDVITVGSLIELYNAPRFRPIVPVVLASWSHADIAAERDQWLSLAAYYSDAKAFGFNETARWAHDRMTTLLANWPERIDHNLKTDGYLHVALLVNGKRVPSRGTIRRAIRCCFPIRLKTISD